VALTGGGVVPSIAPAVDGLDWAGLRDQLDGAGYALTRAVLDAGECRWLADLYYQDHLFRATVDMERLRFGAGQYRYFAAPLPDPVAALRGAFWPHLLPVAREWAARLGRPSPWPDSLDEWLDQCHAAGQGRPTPLMLRYGPGDWNALHRDLYGDLVFPLQVVIGLDRPGSTTPAVSSSSWSSGREPSPAVRLWSWARARPSSSPLVTGRCAQPAAGRPHPSATASALCTLADGEPWG